MLTAPLSGGAARIPEGLGWEAASNVGGGRDIPCSKLSNVSGRAQTSERHLNPDFVA